MKQTSECISCGKRYKTLTKNHKCFSCDKETWYVQFKSRKEKKIVR